MDIKRVFDGASGLNTVVDPVRVPHDNDTGVTDLSLAVNIDIDPTGRVSRRQGFTKAQDGNFHSLFCAGGDCYVCKGTLLYRVGVDLTLQGVRSGLTGNTIHYCQTVGGVFYSDGTYNGVLKGSVSIPWPVDTYYGPNTNRNFTSAPVGTHIAYYQGRIYIAQEDVLWNSEPYRYGLFDQAKGFNWMDSDILMVAPVVSGLFVSTRTKIVFLRGTAGNFVQEQVADYPAIENSLAIERVDGLEIGLKAPGLCRVWATPEGAMLGTSEGLVINLNKKKVVYEESVAKGAGVLRGYQFIHNMY